MTTGTISTKWGIRVDVVDYSGQRRSYLCRDQLFDNLAEANAAIPSLVKSGRVSREWVKVAPVAVNGTFHELPAGEVVRDRQAIRAALEDVVEP